MLKWQVGFMHWKQIHPRPSLPLELHMPMTLPSTASLGWNPSPLDMYENRISPLLHACSWLSSTIPFLFLNQKAHTDSIFDLAWLDEEHVVTCARDSKLALWRVNDPLDSLSLSSGKPSIKNVDMTSLKLEYHNAMVVAPCQNADKLRAVLFNSDSKEIATISLNAYIHVWDPQEFRQVKAFAFLFLQDCSAI